MEVIDSREMALLIARAAQGKKAEDVVILDISKLSDIADYFVIASGTSGRQVKAIADEVSRTLEKEGVRIGHIEGYPRSSWILLDCGSVVAHIFYEEIRKFYSLERLWGDAPCLHLNSIRKRTRANKVRA